MGYGIKGHFGIGKETTWGSAQAVTDYVKIMNEGLAMQFDRFDVTNIHGSVAEPDDVVGIKRIEGEVEFSGHPVSIGYFLKSCFVQNSMTPVLSGQLWTTQYRSPTADFSAGQCAGQPYTLEVFRDVTSAQQYYGAVVSRLTMGFAPNQDVRVTAGFIAKGTTVIAATTPTYPGSPAKPFTFESVSLSIGGSGTTRLEALTITIDNQYEGIPALNQSQEIAKILRRGPQMITLSGTFDFPDLTEYYDFLNQTERQFKINVTRANSFSMLVDLPRVNYTTFPAALRGRERVTVDFEAKAWYHSGSGTAIDIQLTTVKSAF